MAMLSIIGRMRGPLGHRALSACGTRAFAAQPMPAASDNQEEVRALSLFQLTRSLKLRMFQPTFFHLLHLWAAVLVPLTNRAAACGVLYGHLWSTEKHPVLLSLCWSTLGLDMRLMC